jgi:hypothetical protein
MKTLTLELEDDGTFNGRIHHDGAVVASASGNAQNFTVTGMVHEFTNMLRVINTVIHGRGEEVKRGRGEWSIHEMEPRVWGIQLPGQLDSIIGFLSGFTSDSAARSARATMRPMWAALVNPPGDIYEAFHTDGKGWGFLNRAGELHCDFKTRDEAQERAARREDADYAAAGQTTQHAAAHV